jgi:cell division protein FtsL
MMMIIMIIIIITIIIMHVFMWTLKLAVQVRISRLPKQISSNE